MTRLSRERRMVMTYSALDFHKDEDDCAHWWAREEMDCLDLEDQIKLLFLDDTTDDK